MPGHCLIGMPPLSNDPDDTTFWPALPCRDCQATEVPFCLDAACERHVAKLLKVLVFDERGDCLVIRNEPVPPLTQAPARCWHAPPQYNDV
jgi:hypothetical protein